ncbi:sulfite exporter TauE/SafE family protein [Candidatus Saganbacteria bacterium]|nr:sulfite exporter TauE/SafE family protein [Candidatus Saganbacteria bacterium]
MNQPLNIFIAFTGGVLAFFSPCFLPLVPAYLIYITGLSLIELKHLRLKTIIHSLAFILGFTLIFTLFGVAISLVGDWFYPFKTWVRIAGSIFIILLGVYLTGIIRLPWLDEEKRFTIVHKPAGYLGSFFVGMVFALGWTPCIGPILAAILTLASQAGGMIPATFMLISFSFGLGLPLFLLSLTLGTSLALIKKLEKYLRWLHLIFGLLLVIVGLLLLMGRI